MKKTITLEIDVSVPDDMDNNSIKKHLLEELDNDMDRNPFISLEESWQIFKLNLLVKSITRN